MEPEFWLSRWQEGRHGFHQERVHPDLERFEAEFLGDGPHRVLVPLCGKTLDLAWLAARGHEVVGVELSPVAVAAVFEREGLTPEVDHLGPFERSRAGAITVLRGDVFEATPELVGTFDRVWDRAAIVALDEPRRPRYVATVRALMAPGARLLQNAFAYDQTKMDGPPWSVPEAEIQGHYGDWSIQPVLEDVLTEGKFAERGVPSWTVTRYFIDRPQ